jgi:hypothetical protein
MKSTTSPDIQKFLAAFRQCTQNNTFKKCTMGKPASKSQELRNIFIRPVEIGGKTLISFVFRNSTNDITKNLTPEEALQRIETALGSEFLQANLFCTENDFQLMLNKKGNIKLKIMKPSEPLLETFSHDRIKKRLINPEEKPYLRDLEITGKDFRVLPSMNSKFRQINKFIEIIESILPADLGEKKFSVVDMGSGKGYLTFALYDFLVNTKKIQAIIKGVEIRKNLVEKCNHISKKNGFVGLSFEEHNIQDYDLPETNMLIALHACDTATDDAIFKGIVSGAQFIIVAPCCHKQVRKAMKPAENLKPLLKHGIYLERQAELLTDGIRGLILEKYGYKIKTLEFISTEHTPKNVMIIAVKTGRNVDKDKIAAQIMDLKTKFGIDYHHLETLMAGY